MKLVQRLPLLVNCNIVATTSYADNGTITCQGVVLNDTMVIDIAICCDCSVASWTYGSSISECAIRANS